MGGKPFPDDGEPENEHDDRGGADQDFASVVFDEDFVRNAEIHEPSAAERLREAEAARAAVAGGRPVDEDPFEGYPYGWPHGLPDGYGPDDLPYGEHNDPYDHGHGPYGAYGGSMRPYRGRSRWLRPVAWVLAVVMGIGMVALAFTAVYRGASGSSGDPGQTPPPASRTPLTEVGGGGAFTHPAVRQP